MDNKNINTTVLDALIKINSSNQAIIQAKFIPPFRVGKKQKRAVLDSRGYEIVIFPIGLEDLAQDYCNYLNKKNKVIN